MKVLGVSDNFRLEVNFTRKHVRHNGIKSLLINDFIPDPVCTKSGTDFATVYQTKLSVRVGNKSIRFA